MFALASYINIALVCALPISDGTFLQTFMNGSQAEFGLNPPAFVHNMVVSLLAFGLYALAALPSVSTTANTPYCSVFETVGSTAECRSLPSNFLSSREASTSSSTATIKSATPDINILQNTFKALADLQNDYFNQAHNTWPDAIDWTAAVIQTIVTATMSTLTQSLDAAVPGQDWKQKENLLSFLHEQIVSSYFGQQADRILDEVQELVIW